MAEKGHSTRATWDHTGICNLLHKPCSVRTREALFTCNLVQNHAMWAWYSAAAPPKQGRACGPRGLLLIAAQTAAPQGTGKPVHWFKGARSRHSFSKTPDMEICRAVLI